MVYGPEVAVEYLFIKQQLSRMQFFRMLGRAFAGLVPAGLPLTVRSGPLAGMKWIAGAAAGKGKGLSVLFNRCEPAQLEFAKSLLSGGMTCYDIGANVGLYTLLFAKYAKTVYAFEPLPRNLRYLVQAINTNNLTNVQILPCALSDKDGIAMFEQNENCAMGSLAERGDITVLVKSGDLISIQTGSKPHIIKVDVEGAELLVLHGLRETISSNHPIILLSVHSAELRNDCLDFLSSIGYRNCRPLNGPTLDDCTEIACRFA